MKTTKEMIAVMQAKEDDAEIEFLWLLNDYQVRQQEPREWWLNTYSTGSVFGYASANAANCRAGSDRLDRVHVIEVLDDD